MCARVCHVDWGNDSCPEVSSPGGEMRTAIMLVALSLGVSGCGWWDSASDQVEAEMACENLIPQMVDDPAAEVKTTRSTEHGDDQFRVTGSVEWRGGRSTWLCQAVREGDQWVAYGRDAVIMR